MTIDWRGQGDTPAARGGSGMDSLTADAVALIAELGLVPVHWVGLSMGGFVGQRLAARHGELLRSLTPLDTSAEAETPDRARAVVSTGARFARAVTAADRMSRRRRHRAPARAHRTGGR